MADRVAQRQNNIHGQREDEGNNSGFHHQPDIVEDFCAGNACHHVGAGGHRGTSVTEVNPRHEYSCSNNRVYPAASCQCHKYYPHGSGYPKGSAKSIAEQT